MRSKGLRGAKLDMAFLGRCKDFGCWLFGDLSRETARLDSSGPSHSGEESRSRELSEELVPVGVL